MILRFITWLLTDGIVRFGFSHHGIPVPTFDEIVTRHLRKSHTRDDEDSTSQMRDHVVEKYRLASAVHPFLSASGLNALLDRYLPWDGNTYTTTGLRKHRLASGAFQYSIDFYSSYISLCDHYLSAGSYVHEKLPLAAFVWKLRSTVLTNLSHPGVVYPMQRLREQIDLYVWEATNGQSPQAQQWRAKEAARKEEEEAKRREQEALAQAEAEKRRRTDDERASCQNLIDLSQAELQLVETEIQQVQRSNFDPGIIDEELARLNPRKADLLRKIIQLRTKLSEIK